MKQKNKRGFDPLSIVFFISAALLLWLELFPPELSYDATVNSLCLGIITRALGGALFIALTFRLGWHIWGIAPRGGRSLVAMLPALAVVVNNFPIIGIVSGAARVTAPAWQVCLFALSSLLIGVFEEFAFRGVFYMLLLSNHRSSKKQIFWVSVASSAVFGAVHLFNLLAGAGVGATLLQVGYSFLIGGMCSIALIVTGSIWIPVLLHALFDFGGYLIPTLGEGLVWDTATVVITALLGVCVTFYMVFLLLRVEPQCLEKMFPGKTSGEEDMRSE